MSMITNLPRTTFNRVFDHAIDVSLSKIDFESTENDFSILLARELLITKRECKKVVVTLSSGKKNCTFTNSVREKFFKNMKKSLDDMLENNSSVKWQSTLTIGTIKGKGEKADELIHLVYNEAIFAIKEALIYHGISSITPEELLGARIDAKESFQPPSPILSDSSDSM